MNLAPIRECTHPNHPNRTCLLAPILKWQLVLPSRVDNLRPAKRGNRHHGGEGAARNVRELDRLAAEGAITQVPGEPDPRLRDDHLHAFCVLLCT